MSFDGGDGLAGCIEYLRRSFSVKTEGMKFQVRWHGRLKLDYEHLRGERNLFAFRFKMDENRNDVAEADRNLN